MSTSYDIQKIGIVGAGMMGAGIAEVSAAAGFPTVLVKATPGDTESVRGRIEKSLARRVSKGKLAQSDADAALARLEVTADRGALADRDLIIESIVENLAEKRMLFSQLEGEVRDEAVFASNTSTLRIRDLAEGHRVDRTIGLHFFSPVPAMSLVELAHLPETDPTVIEGATAFVEGLGKTAVPVSDSTGFIVNRLLVPYLLGAMRAYGQGLAEAPSIDTAMKLGCGYPMGPFELMDVVGLDITLAIMERLLEEYRQNSYEAAPLLRRMVDAGFLGRKVGRGFYVYD